MAHAWRWPRVESGTSADTTFVTNVADDWCVGGLPVCPDTDAVLYALSGRFDEDRGWGIVGDVFPGTASGRAAVVRHRRRRSRDARAPRGQLLDAGASLSPATQVVGTRPRASRREWFR